MRIASFSYISENQLRCTPSNYAGVCLQNTYDYSAFGVSLDGRTLESDFYRCGFNGMEKVDEIHGGKNSYDMGARLYSPYSGRPFSPDPLIILNQMFPDLSPYNFAGNTPIQAIDLQGLQPESVITRNSDGTYRFTEPAIKLMSWLSGTDEETLRNTNLKPRSRPFGAPWYPSKEGGGAMTSDKKIRYTRNYFKGWKHSDTNPYYYFGGNDNHSVDAWLALSSHETGHLKQRKEFKTNLGYYLSFVGEYIKGGSHDASGKEQDANNGYLKYEDFVKFTNKNYGDKSLFNLFNNKDLKEEDKTKQLGEWMEAYDQNEATTEGKEKE